MDLKYHPVTELVKNNEIELVQVSTQNVAADCLTKPLSGLKQRKGAEMIQLTML